MLFFTTVLSLILVVLWLWIRNQRRRKPGPAFTKPDLSVLSSLFNVDCKGGDGRYQLISGGCLSTLMSCGDHILADEKLISLLLKSDTVGFTVRKNAVLWRRRENREFHTHLEITVDDQFRAGGVPQIPLNSKRVLKIDGILFVTPPLKDILEETFDDLVFHRGLSEIVY